MQTTGTGAPPFHVVHNGVDLEQLAALSKTLPESELHELLHLNASSTPIVGFVARLDAQKNPLKWLEVAARVAASNRAVHFVMIGTGPLRRELEAKIEQYAARLATRLVRRRRLALTALARSLSLQPGCRSRSASTTWATRSSLRA